MITTSMVLVVLLVVAVMVHVDYNINKVLACRSSGNSS